MSKYKDHVVGVLNSYKCVDKNDQWRLLPIHNEEGVLVGFLKPVTIFYYKAYPRYVLCLNKWRTENQEGFHDEFENSPSKTRSWFDDILLPREDRLLFFIHLLDDTLIGHIGVSSFNFKDKSCEIDNVVRGRKACSFGIMSHATKTIISWVQSEGLAKDIFLRVFSDNHHAIEFYKKNNFISLFDLSEDGRKDGLFYTYMKYKK